MASAPTLTESAAERDERLREAAGRAARNRWRKKICEFVLRFDTLTPEAQEQSRRTLRKYGRGLDSDLEADLDKALDAVRAGKDPRGALDWEKPPSDNDIESLTPSRRRAISPRFRTGHR